MIKIKEGSKTKDEPNSYYLFQAIYEYDEPIYSCLAVSRPY